MTRLNWRSLAIACCLAVLATAGMAAAPAMNARAAVTLVEMTATALDDGTIKVTWVTATELQTTAFQLYRSLSATYPSTAWAATGSPIAAFGDGHTYTYIDSSNLAPSTTYYYLLEEIESDANSTRVRYPGFIRSVTSAPPAGSTSTFTPTPSATPTMTPTPTATTDATNTPADQPTATRQFTNTPIEGTPWPTTTRTPNPSTGTTAASSTPVITPRLATPTGQAGATGSTPLPSATATRTAAAATSTVTATRAVTTTAAATFTPSMTPSPVAFSSKGTAQPVLRETPARTSSSSTPVEGAQPNERWALIVGGIAVALAVVLGAAAVILWLRRRS